MSMFVLAEESDDPSKGEVEDALAGNLCRCTGYGPIIEAAQTAAGQSAKASWRDNMIDRLREIQPREMVSLEHQSGLYFSPSNVDEMATTYAKHPDATILAGGTDVGLWVTKMNRKLGRGGAHRSRPTKPAGRGARPMACVQLYSYRWVRVRIGERQEDSADV